VFAPDSEKGEVVFLQRGTLSLPCCHWGAHYCGSTCMPVSQCNSYGCLKYWWWEKSSLLCFVIVRSKDWVTIAVLI